MKIVSKLGCLALILWASSSNAYFVDGNDLVSDMHQWQRASQGPEHTDYVKSARYSSYVLGVYDALSLNDIVCSHGRTTAGQVSAVVAKYLKKNPERWSEPAFLLVSNALTKAFACKKH